MLALNGSRLTYRRAPVVGEFWVKAFELQSSLRFEKCPTAVRRIESKLSCRKIGERETTVT